MVRCHLPHPSVKRLAGAAARGSGQAWAVGGVGSLITFWEASAVPDSKPCGVEVPFRQAIMAQALEKITGRVLWVCHACRQRPDMIPADRCEICDEWKPPREAAGP